MLISACHLAEHIPSQMQERKTKDPVTVLTFHTAKGQQAFFYAFSFLQAALQGIPHVVRQRLHLPDFRLLLCQPDSRLFQQGFPSSFLQHLHCHKSDVQDGIVRAFQYAIKSRAEAVPFCLCRALSLCLPSDSKAHAPLSDAER